jgi:hypothetical protein
MLLVGQRDPRWGFKPIGKSNTTIGQAGCTISSLSMLSDFYGCYKDPWWMSQNLSFLVDRILWNSITQKLCFKFIWRFYNYDEKRITDSLNGKTTSVLLQVHGNHWVVGIKKLGNYYYVADPWTKTRRFIHKSEISGGATFKK